MLDFSTIRPSINIHRNSEQQILFQVWEAPDAIHEEIASLTQLGEVTMTQIRATDSAWYLIRINEDVELFVRNYAQVLWAKFKNEVVIQDFVNHAVRN